MNTEIFNAILKYIDKKKLANDVLSLHLIPAAEKAAADTEETSIDDTVVAAIKLLTERFLG